MKNTAATPAQQVLLNTIRMLIEKHQYGPTVGEIMAATKGNRNTICAHLQTMRKQGLVKVAHGGMGWVPS